MCGEGVLSCKCRLASRLDDVRNEHLRLRFGVDVVALSEDEFEALMIQYLEEEMEKERLANTLDRQREEEEDDEDKKDDKDEKGEDEKDEDEKGGDEDEGEEVVRDYFRHFDPRQIPRGRMPPNPPGS
ncbi:hypothetical protein KJ359_005681 [Pestalotiopsis sp. 9143b]|nr:hypothetical protein KJ359_005681 [Pestalotiopsis sp. 9143b]